MSSNQFESSSELSLGEYLRNEREKKGLTIEQVASATKINIRILHALEENQYEELPAKPFIRGFVTSYARFVHLDPQELLSKYENFLDEKARNRPEEESGHSGYVFEKKDVDQSRTVLWVIMGSFIFVGILVMIIFKPTLKHKRGHHVEKQIEKLKLTAASPTVGDSPTTAPSSLPEGSVVNSATPLGSENAGPKNSDKLVQTGLQKVSPTPDSSPGLVASVIAISPKPESSPALPIVPSVTAIPSVLPSLKPDPLNSGVNIPPSEIKHKLVLKALADVWVRYQVDDRQVSKFILREGRILVLRGAVSIVFQASNPRAVAVNYNRAGVSVMSQVKTLTKKTENATLLYGESSQKTASSIMSGEKPLEQTAEPTPRMDTQISPSM